jgi:hypothetical protein
MEKLTYNDQIRLQNIIQYYNEYRKIHYDNNVEIDMENRRREEENREIEQQLHLLKDVQKTEKYMFLHYEKIYVYEQMEKYNDIIYENMLSESYDLEIDNNEIVIAKNLLEILENTLELIEQKQLEHIQDYGIDTKWLQDKNKKILL